ncbi:SemiSWEET transporter [Phyllobacterium sp. R2-JL]|jgi:MtN3 and saliva related transmembrane protein|nr:SemiSWEET transporter [Phyllobacterium calauticae]
MIPLYFFEEFAHISILSFLKDRSVPLHIELVGSLAALITTLCWVPQIIKIVRHRETGSISLISNASLALGVLLWLFYGIMISSWPVIAANATTLLLILTILGLKLRYG